ncbi:MAG: protein phosphatase 2C domain-containing protein [Pseudomonadota bacterium]
MRDARPGLADARAAARAPVGISTPHIGLALQKRLSLTDSAAMQIYARTDPGRVRDNNEDAVAFDASAGVAVLADGMGGLNAGEVASEVAVDVVMDALVAGADLDAAVSRANARVFELAQTSTRLQSMGTTLVAVRLEADGLACANVGDSRLYRLRDDGLEQLSRDHSIVQQFVDSGVMTADEAWQAPNRNVITRAVGVELTVEAELHRFDVRPGDRFLLCSDGLSDMLRATHLEELVRKHADAPQVLLAALVEAANAAGGEDNISAVWLVPD